VDQDSSGVRCERGAETINGTDVGVERKCAVEDDNQTLNLAGGVHCGAVYGEEERCQLWIGWIWCQQEGVQFYQV